MAARRAELIRATGARAAVVTLDREGTVLLPADVLHRGHTRYLNQAKQLGDILVVALNSDDSVRRLKGPDRPINTLADRAAVIAALSCVDYVTVFGTPTPILDYVADLSTTAVERPPLVN